MAGLKKWSSMTRNLEESEDSDRRTKDCTLGCLTRTGSSAESDDSLRNGNDITYLKSRPVWEIEDNENEWIESYLELGIQWLSLLTENIFSHPFIVLQRQCQVFNTSQKYHLHPISLFPSIVNLHRSQKITTLWKGLGSCLLIRGMTVAIEDLFSKQLSWPKIIHSRTSLKGFGQHVLLKCLSIAVVTPFQSASLVETVQSDIASEKPGVLDVFREGFQRLLCWTEPKKGRIIPIWVIMGPNIFIGVGRHMLRLIIKGIFNRVATQRKKVLLLEKGGKHFEDSLYDQNCEMYSNFFSFMMCNVIFYPFETILYRLQLQGTRTIIDNLDSGRSVVPILTSYRGAIDCYKTTVSSEGVCGLYKGFGAALLQVAAHIAIIKITKWSITQFARMISPRQKLEQYSTNFSMRLNESSNNH